MGMGEKKRQEQSIGGVGGGGGDGGLNGRGGAEEDKDRRGGEAKHLEVTRGALSYLYDVVEAVLDVGGKGNYDIQGEVGDVDALCDDLDYVLWNDAHCTPTLPSLSSYGRSLEVWGFLLLQYSLNRLPSCDSNAWELFDCMPRRQKGGYYSSS